MDQFEKEFPADLEDLNNKMKALMEIEQADELDLRFKKFKEDADAIMKKKKDLIAEFQKELDYRDQTYVSSMKQFHIDILKMIRLMNKQFRDIRDTMLDHLGKIEEKFLQERKDILEEQYTKNMAQLIKDLNNMGNKKSQQLTEQQTENEKKARENADKTENNYINKVILMETHLNHIKERVEEYLYEIKILYEKLSYRLKIREEKIKEAELKKKQFNTWSAELSEKINYLTRQYRANDEKRRLKNSQLKTELLKMTESYETLKEKFKHFEKHDELRFNEIYDMKSREAKELALKVILADRTIKTQQLGMENLINDQCNGFTYEELQKEENINEQNEKVKRKTPEQEMEEFKQNILEKISIPRVKEVFKYIIQEGEFLIETKVLEDCENMTEEEKFPKYMESICKALGIKNETELNQMLDFFYAAAKEKEEKPKAEDEEDNKEEGEEEKSQIQEEDTNVLKINPDEVLTILMKFNEDKKRRNREKCKKKF
ncbi:MAG: hypothetical protein MJ252_26240 [archaeon]|nr:hypothetical protein [archaeon]